MNAAAANLGNKIRGPRGDMAGELEVHLDNALVSVGVGLRLERRLSAAELVAQHSQRPQIHLVERKKVVKMIPYQKL